MENSYVKLYSGTEIEVLAAQALLTEHDIPFIVKNEHTSGVLAGFYGGEVVRLYVLKAYEEQAKVLLSSL
jgi:TusA-related sulfurtransferase